MNIDSAAESERSLVAKGLDKTVAIYGAGIAGLSAAHELAKRGWQVSVYETNAGAGGFFRSARVAGDHNMPSEYSWHGMGPGTTTSSTCCGRFRLMRAAAFTSGPCRDRLPSASVRIKARPRSTILVAGSLPPRVLRRPFEQVHQPLLAVSDH